jgi:hypothetical protein
MSDDMSLEALPASGTLAFVLHWHDMGVDFPISGDGTTISGQHVR